MNRIVSLGLIALTMSCANGGVVRDDSLLDMVQGMVSNPELYASALGMERVKRSAWDKEFNFQKMGFNFKIKYQDPANRLKGGVAEATFQDLRKFVRRSPVKSAKFVVNFDGGNNQKDGLFNFNIDYELGFLFGGQDSGKLRFDRKMDGAFFNTNVEFMSNSKDNEDRPPTVQLDMKSDYKTKADLRFFFDNHSGKPQEYKTNIEFVNQDTFKGKFDSGKKVYNFEGKYNKAEQKFDVVVDIDGQKYNGHANVDFDGSKAAFDAKFDLGAYGKVDAAFDVLRDFSSAGFKVLYNDKDIFTAKLKGKMDEAPRKFSYELRYSGMIVDDGKLRVTYERFKELKVQYLPKTGTTMEYITEVAADQSLQQRLTATYNNVKEFESLFKIAPFNDAQKLGFNAKMNWFIKERSPFYKFFYKYDCIQCLTAFNLESNLSMEKAKLYKFDFDLTSFAEDGSSHKEVYLTTKDKYYASFSTHFLNEMAHAFGSYNRFEEDFVVQAEHNPGKFLKVTSNRPWFKSFSIENMDGYMRKVEFNGKELLKAGVGKDGRQIKQTIELPSGEKMDTQVNWETDSYFANKAKLTFNGPRANKAVAEFDWDFSDAAAKKLKFSAEGDNELVGTFKVTRDYEYKQNGQKYSLVRKGVFDVPSSPLPPNFETEIDAEVDGDNVNFGVYFFMAGSKYGFNMQNGNLVWVF